MMNCHYLVTSCFVSTDHHGGEGVLNVCFTVFFSVTPHLLPPPSLELISLSIHSDKVQFCICIFLLSTQFDQMYF